MTEREEITSPGSAPPSSAFVDEREDSASRAAKLYAQLVGQMLNEQLAPIKQGLARVADEVMAHERRITALEMMRLYIPALALIVASVALLVALVALLHGGTP